MTNLFIAESFFYSPNAPQQCALKLHSSLQQFSW